MGDYEGRTTVHASVDELFDYLSRVENLPTYMSRMTEAHSVTGDEVSVEARIEGGDVGSSADQETVRGDAWFRIDADARRIEWGAEGPHDYSGDLEVSPQGDAAEVVVHLHTMHDAPGIQDGLDSTLSTIERLAEKF